MFLEKGKLVYEGNIDALLLNHSTDSYLIKTLVDNKIEIENVRGEDKNSYIANMLSRKIDIIGIEKEKITLEEIVYKIKK